MNLSQLDEDKMNAEIAFEQAGYAIQLELQPLWQAFHDGTYPEESRDEANLLKAIRKIQESINELAICAGALCAIASIERALPGTDAEEE